MSPAISWSLFAAFQNIKSSCNTIPINAMSAALPCDESDLLSIQEVFGEALGFATPESTIAQLKLPNLNRVVLEHRRTYLSPNDTVRILKRKAPTALKEKRGPIAAKILEIEAVQVAKKARRDAGIIDPPTQLPPFVQSHWDYGFLVTWKVWKVSAAAEDDDMDDAGEDGVTTVDDGKVEYRVNHYTTAKRMSEIIIECLSAHELPRVVSKQKPAGVTKEAHDIAYQGMLERVNGAVAQMRPQLDKLRTEEPPAVFLPDKVKPGPKVFLLVSGCSPAERQPDVTSFMYDWLIGKIEAAGNMAVQLATRNCGDACVAYRQKKKQGLCARYSVDEKRSAHAMVHAAVAGIFQPAFVRYVSTSLGLKETFDHYTGEASIVPIFMGAHAGCCLSALECMKMQTTVPSGYGPHLCMTNDLPKADKVAGIFQAFGIPMEGSEVKEQLLLHTRACGSHAKGSATLIAQKEAALPGAEYCERLEERSANGKDVMARCTLCDAKVIRGNWRNHAQGEMHKARVAALQTEAEATASSAAEVAFAAQSEC